MIRLYDLREPHLVFKTSFGNAACFSGALNLVASKAGKADLAKDAKVEVKVWLGKLSDREGFGLEGAMESVGIRGVGAV